MIMHTTPSPKRLTVENTPEYIGNGLQEGDVNSAPGTQDTTDVMIGWLRMTTE